jgi:nucleotide-binding universal stress UspA family protein
MTTLIVATDGSDLAFQAALAGVSLTRPADKLLVVSAVDLIDPAEDATGHAGPTITSEQAEASNREAKAQGQAAVAASAEALRVLGYAPEQIETRLVEGAPGPALCRLASDVDASALIIGSRGRGGLKRALLGSVSDYIVRNAPCSVVVSRSTGL